MAEKVFQLKNILLTLQFRRETMLMETGESSTRQNVESVKASWPVRVWRFYYDGFRNMTSLGRQLWVLILLKLFIFFVILKLFFFPDLLKRDYDDDAERAQTVRTHLSNPDKR